MSPILDSKLLQAFTVIARTCNLRQASKELFLTPSALSHALRKLEEDVGVSLFQRTSRSMKLTEAGKTLLEDCHHILQCLDNARFRLHQSTDWRTGRLRIGASPSACQYILPAVLREFKESFPDYSISIVSGSAKRLHSGLLDESIDLAFGPIEDEPETTLDQEIILRDTLTFLLHPLHPWAEKRRVDRKTIGSQRFILTESSSVTKKLIDEYFLSERISIQPFIEISNEEVIKQLVRLDLGIGVFPSWIARAEIESGSLVSLPVGSRPLQRSWAVRYPKKRSNNFAQTLLIGLFRNVALSAMGKF
ncbi:MAG: LysR family transcriptional regulator [Opitutales bacterium]|nr:LysR family transcriptional regulator [Opitutales bacterium]MCH8540072.1 LysR family transcriptional regulator [Opitutales bacterium]